MKKILVLLFVVSTYNLLLNIQVANSQWVQQYNAGNVYLNAIQFTSNNTGYAVGESLFDTTRVILLKTTNGGTNWFYLELGNNNKPGLQNISFIDDLTGYVCGEWINIFKTTNGGINWTYSVAPVFENINYYAIQFLNEQTGYIGGRYGMRAKTTNAGVNWFTLDTAISRINAIHFFDINTGLMSDGYSGIYRTTNGGANWIYKYQPDSANIPYSLNNFSFSNDNTGYVVGNTSLITNLGILLKTTNKGVDWSIVRTFPQQMYSICALNNGAVYAGGFMNYVIYSSNAGSSWSNQVLPVQNSITNSIYFSNNNTGYCCDNGGNICRTTNGGVRVENISTEIPSKYYLSQNYPNPFNPSTKIKFDIPALSFPSVSIGNPITLKVYDIMGREVQTLVNERLQPGTYEVFYDGSGQNSGVYFYKLTTPNSSITKSMVLIK